MQKNHKKMEGIALITVIIIIAVLVAVGVTITILVKKNINNDNQIQAEIGKENVNSGENATQSTTKKVNEENIKEYTDDEVPIPKGFYYVGGTKDDGVIISDSAEDENKGTTHEAATQMQGNQFVWVPVENEANFKRYPGYDSGEIQEDFINNTDEPYENGYDGEEKEYNSMKQSVLQHNGFYVARYEASKDETNQTKVASKQGKEVWNYIAWGDSTSEIGTEGAVYQAQQMYTDKNTYGVTSTLIYGVQWDAIMTWIDPEYKTGNCDTNTSFVANSEEKGNYNYLIDDPTVTGSDSNYAVKNIYDLAGNVSEWTMETYASSNKVLRGGGFYYSGLSAPASVRQVWMDLRDDNNSTFGFRVALYL